ncbi:SpoIIE family protein phosphatase [Streptomyces formicae]|uniref:SpoIIE family protein phosphatase n=1 Tax=Streptomyces formicae TaxID=1616117 RepID=A0ABY3WG70_9ACTN|nr:SpoIIE family protein phosphatase [Streptomyces formicae]
MPYETTMLDLEPGSVLALCTDGLVEHRDRDIDQELRRLTDALAVSASAVSAPAPARAGRCRWRATWI